MNLPHEIAEKVISKRYLELETRPHIIRFCDHTGYEYYLPDSWVPHGFFCEMSFVEITISIKEHTAHKLQQYDRNSNYIIPEDFSIKSTN